MSDGRGRRPLRTFGRTGGRPLSGRQQALIRDRLPQLAVPHTADGALDPVTLFGDAAEVWLEIGFGGGEHMIEQARRNPHVGLIGCEPYIEGMAKALTGIETQGLTNIRLHMDDARPVMAMLKRATIARVFILFPDPWPKKKHHKRRLIQPGFLDELARICLPDARIRFATDIKSYANEALETFLNHPAFHWLADSAADWRAPPADHITTRYETKRLGDCAPVFYDFLTGLHH